MKKDSDPLRTSKTFSVTVPRELKRLIKELARANGRSVSSYLSWLVLQDTSRKKVEKR